MLLSPSFFLSFCLLLLFSAVSAHNSQWFQLYAIIVFLDHVRWVIHWMGLKNSKSLQCTSEQKRQRNKQFTTTRIYCPLFNVSIEIFFSSLLSLSLICLIKHLKGHFECGDGWTPIVRFFVDWAEKDVLMSPLR